MYLAGFESHPIYLVLRHSRVLRDTYLLSPSIIVRRRASRPKGLSIVGGGARGDRCWRGRRAGLGCTGRTPDPCICRGARSCRGSGGEARPHRRDSLENEPSCPVMQERGRRRAPGIRETSRIRSPFVAPVLHFPGQGLARCLRAKSPSPRSATQHTGWSGGSPSQPPEYPLGQQRVGRYACQSWRTPDLRAFPKALRICVDWLPLRLP